MVNDYTRIKTQERPRVGPPEEPIAELAKLGWVILSPENKKVSTNILFTKTSLHHHENLCSLDCSGIEDKHDKNNKFVYGEFQKQLGQDSVWNHETTLSGKKIILHYVVILRIALVGEYNKIVQVQINQGIIEKVNETKSPEKGKEFYLPHRLVI